MKRQAHAMEEVSWGASPESFGLWAVAPPRDLANDSDDRGGRRRARLETEVSLTSESQFFSDLSGDISEGGLFVATYRAVAVGTVIDIEFSLPDGPVRAVGRIQWTRPGGLDLPPGLGIAFVALAEEDRRRIQLFCERRSPLYCEP